MNTVEDYHDLYLKIDVLLLISVFKTFRKESINYFELDPGYYLSTPDCSWNTVLRFADVNLKIISDIEKKQFIGSTIRVGISMIRKSYAEAYHKFLKAYDTNKPTWYIIYLDVNNLYKHSVMQLLPTEILD